MHLREALPWNWGRKDVQVKREGETSVVPSPSSIFDLFDELQRYPLARGGRPSLGGLGFGADGGFLPALNAKETDEEVRISVELPGLGEKDVEVVLKDDVLTIKGEKQDESTHEEGGTQWVERRYGSFRRDIPLPADVDGDQVKAHFLRTRQGI